MVKPLVPPAVDILGPYVSTPQHVLARPGRVGDAAGAGFTWIKDCTDDNAEDGTPITAEFLNNLKAQLLTVFQGSGIEINDSDAMLAAAIRSQWLNYVVPGGTANALTFALDPTLPARIPGMPIRLKIPATNTGPVTVHDGIGLVNVTTMSGSPLAKGDLPKDSIPQIRWNGTSYLVSGLVYSETLRPLAGDLTLYVRPDGSDNNDGSANTAAGAFLTIQAAITYATRRFFTAGYLITIQLADGNYAGFSVVENTQCRLLIRGNPGAPANVVITAGAGLSGVLAMRTATLSINGVTFTGGANGASAVDRSLIELSNCRFGATANYQIFAQQSSTINVLTATDFFGSAKASMVASSNSTVSASNLNLRYIGALTYSVATVWGNNGSVIVDSSSFFGGGGTVTGARYQSDTGGLVYVNNGGPAFIIGSVNGSVFTGGIYV